MPNEQNIIPHCFTSDQSREAAAKNGAAGGRASGVSRRRKRDLRQAAELYLSLPVVDKRMSDETDLDEIIEKLTGKPEDPDEAKMIGAEDAKCGAMPAATKDAAVELLRRVRPAVAAIEDKAARARVTDALLGAVKGDNAMTAIAQAAYDSAAAAAKSTSRSTFDQICAESEAAYAAMNPHKTK